MEAENCIECGAKLLGRSDKKFCCDACRSQYHNRLNADHNRLMRQINHSLRKNRRILQELMDSGQKTIRRRILLRQGFDFEAITAMRKRRSGEECFFCYEYGYIPLTDEKYRLLYLEQK